MSDLEGGLGVARGWPWGGLGVACSRLGWQGKESGVSVAKFTGANIGADSAPPLDLADNQLAAGHIGTWRKRGGGKVVESFARNPGSASSLTEHNCHFLWVEV